MDSCKTRSRALNLIEICPAGFIQTIGLEPTEGLEGHLQRFLERERIIGLPVNVIRALPPDTEQTPAVR